MNKIKNWVSTHKPATVGIICAVIIAIIAAITLWFTTPPAEPEDTPNVAQVEGTGKINFDVKANDGWTKDSTPAIAHITGSKDDKSKDNDTVDFYHAINATEDNHGTSTVTVPAGDYKIEFVSPVNTDGSAYEIYDTGKTTEVTVIGIKEPAKAPEAKTEDKTEDKSTQPAPDAEGSAVKDAKKDSTDNKLDDKCYINETPVHQEIKKIPAEQVTDEMLKDIVNKVNAAIANGDDTLKGDKGKEIVKKLEEGVKANPNASVETKGEAEETTKTEAVNEPAKTAETTENSSPVAKPTETQKPTQNKSEAQAPAPQPAPTPAPEPAPKPKEPIYEDVWVSNWVTEQVWIGEKYVFAHDNYITMDLNDATSHQKTLVKQGFPSNYSVIDVYEPKQVDKGHWEKKLVGYK